MISRLSAGLIRAYQSDLAYNFRKSPVALVAAFVALTLVLAAVFAPLLAPSNPYDPASLNLMDGFTPPMVENAFTGNSYLLGTDNQGRDVLSTILYGARLSLFVGVMAVLFAMLLGIGAGLVVQPIPR